MHSTWELPHFYSMEMLRDPVIRVFSLSLSSLSMIFGIFFFITFFRQFRRGILTNFPYIPKLLLSSYEDGNEKIIDQSESSFSTSHSTGGAEIERKSIPFETIAIFRDRRGSELFFFSSSFRLSPPPLYSRFEVAQTRNATSYDGVFCIIVRETGLPVTGDNTYTLLRLLCR